MTSRPAPTRGLTRRENQDRRRPKVAVVNVPVRRGGEIVAWAVIDADDLEFVSQWRWSMNGSGYAFGAPGFLHRVLLGLEKGDRNEVDHRNRDKMDNRKANLRLVDRTTNMRNTERGDEWPAQRARILELRTQGLRRGEIARLLGVNPATVKRHDGGDPDPLGAPVRWTQERILEAFARFYEETGRVPQQCDLRGNDDLPSFATVYRRFGGLVEAREAAGFGRVDHRRKPLDNDPDVWQNDRSPLRASKIGQRHAV
jgi:hypothetical protein